MIDTPSPAPSSDIVATDPDGNPVTYNELLRRAGQQDAWAWNTLCALNGTEPPGFARSTPRQLELNLGVPPEFDTTGLGPDEGPAPRRLPR